jgi:hypothetical protein
MTGRTSEEWIPETHHAVTKRPMHNGKRISAIPASLQFINPLFSMPGDFRLSRGLARRSREGFDDRKGAVAFL